MSPLSTETSVPLARAAELSDSDSALLEALLKEAPIGFALFGPDLRFQRVNRALCAIYGRVEDDFVGRTPREVLGEAGADAHTAALEAVMGGKSVVNSDPHDPEEGPEECDGERHWAMSWFPAHDAEGKISGVAMIAVDLSDRHQLEMSLRRSEERHKALLQASNQIIWAAQPNGEVTEDCEAWRKVTGQQEDDYLGYGWLNALHPDDQEKVKDTWQEAVDEQGTFEATFRVRTHNREFRYYRSRAVPRQRGGKIVEWVGAHTDITTQREADEMRQRLTQQLGEAALRTVRLQRATSRLAEALTVDQVVQAITEIGHEEVGADQGGVALLDAKRVRFRPLTPDAIPEVQEPASAGVGLDRPGVMANAVRERKVFIAGSPQELRHMLDGAEDVELFLKNTEEQAWVGLPLLSAGSPIGALRFAFHQPRSISDDEKVFLEALAGQCSLALERAEMFEREHRTAEALQNSLLPEELPTVGGMRFASLYSPGAEHVQVGGDWYDAFRLNDNRVGAVLGDVMGKGIQAAIGMSRVRNSLRALALNGPEPASVLSGLDRMFLATEGEEQVTTLAYFVLDPRTGHGFIGNAGHLPPLLVGPGPRPKLIEIEPGTPLGMPSTREHHEFFVPPGNTAVLYSDGLVENRRRGLVSGLDELVDVASHAPAEVVGDPQRLLDYLVKGMLEGYDQNDDITLLAVHVPVL